MKTTRAQQKWEPHNYQRRAIKFIIERACAALWMDPGLGKTSTTLAAFKILKNKKLCSAALIIAPLRVCYSVWPSQIEQWEDFAGLSYSILHGKDKQKAFKTKADLYIINPEGLGWLFSELGRTKSPWPFDFLIIDESTKFKSPTSARFKLLKTQLPKFKRRLELTGSPAPNGMEDIWSQVYILDGGQSLGKYITHFRDSYFFRTGFGGYTYILRPGADERIYDAINHLVLRMEAKDYLDLPPLIENDVYVDLPDEALKKYKEFEKNFLMLMGDQKVVAPNAAALQGKCIQAASGAVYLDDKSWVHLHNAKIDALEDLIEELSGKPALVAYWYHHDLERLREKFPHVPHIGSGVSSKKALELEAAWNKGELPILFVHPASVSHGLNLQQVAGAVIIFTLFWDLEAHEQLVRRLWRQGQKERVVVHRLVARKTVDEDVVKGLASKDKNQKEILQAMKIRTKL